ncbi:universal stress protein [Sulfuracidifex tepidarius]|uniref:Universal stress protein n=1 Tax=Sulfuracidifex tepidarius TaxID=1294262 RepID=A0A510E6S3_9CREN|nr:universal stress protein [Sulfuracidifex tepidarius]BBG25439.1 Universal stress protein [Sulfuracidifex tepidarius]BBG28233.1 Universal stress protein [Sulfuracidifex tepidarius]
MFRSIVVGYDGSEQAAKALKLGKEISKFSSAKLYIVSVVNVCFAYDSSTVPLNDTIDKLKEKAKNDVNSAVQQAKNEGINAEGIVTEGDPASVLVETAEKVNADLIITGNRGLSKLKRAVIGSVSFNVVEMSKIPVLIVK